uniref:Uncharacterized protein n=1 Tax=Arion vulgaris TaxID=1028688 RepID=A0A0B7B1D8_9EUPU
MLLTTSSREKNKTDEQYSRRSARVKGDRFSIQTGNNLTIQPYITLLKPTSEENSGEAKEYLENNKKIYMIY